MTIDHPNTPKVRRRTRPLRVYFRSFRRRIYASMDRNARNIAAIVLIRLRKIRDGEEAFFAILVASLIFIAFFLVLAITLDTSPILSLSSRIPNSISNLSKMLERHAGLAAWAQGVGSLLIIAISVWQTRMAQKAAQKALDRQHWVTVSLFSEAVDMGNSIIPRLITYDAILEWKFVRKQIFPVIEIMRELLNQPIDRWTSLSTKEEARILAGHWLDFDLSIENNFSRWGEMNMERLTWVAEKVDLLSRYGKRWRAKALKDWNH